MLTWWAVGTWAVTAVGGLGMAALFLSHRGMAQSERYAIGPLRVLPHVGFAVAGFGLWVAYAVTDKTDLGWAGMASLGVAFLIAGTFLLTRDQHRRAELAQRQALAAGGTAGTATAPAAVGTPTGPGQPTIPAEHFIPIWLASVHGLLGGATLVLVLLERAGVGTS